MKTPTLERIREYFPTEQAFQEAVAAYAAGVLTGESTHVVAMDKMVRLKPYFPVMKELYRYFEPKLDWFLKSARNPIDIEGNTVTFRASTGGGDNMSSMSFHSPLHLEKYRLATMHGQLIVPVPSYDWTLASYTQAVFGQKPYDVRVVWRKGGSLHVITTFGFSQRELAKVKASLGELCDFEKESITLQRAWGFSSFPLPTISFTQHSYVINDEKSCTEA